MNRTKRTLHRALLRVFRRLPTRLRITAVHLLSPSYTVGAMCVIERADGAVLFVRHSYRPRWGVPGGLSRSGEDVADAARREVAEEAGVAVVLLGEPAVVVDPGSGASTSCTPPGWPTASTRRRRCRCRPRSWSAGGSRPGSDRSCSGRRCRPWPRSIAGVSSAG